ncbi:MAG: IscS subfamily cysteine desulfurase [Gammaproteobacteria bacterium]|nr:IscS subfamily cysteine desulfurase [Gammaproteobacteria bacterium]
MRKPIYLDYMATTPVDNRVVAKMVMCLDKEGVFGNPASTSHLFGWEAKEWVEGARSQVANLVKASEQEIIWTSGATESNNLALKGAAFFYQRKGRHIITSAIEHKSVLDSIKYLEEQKFEITYLSPDRNGIIHPEQVKAAIRPDTILLSIMHVNNEMGVIQNLKAMSEITQSQGIIFHVDAAQSLGKIPINLQDLAIDLMSFSAHKIYGPKGMGALYVRRKPRVRLQPLIHGGGHESSLRSGTLPTHQIVGMGEACEIASKEMQTEAIRIRALRDRLWQGINSLGHVYLNGDYEARIPGNLSASFDFVEGESLLVGLCDLAISSGAACNSATIEPSYVLRAMGIRDELANSTIRFSLGRYTTEEEIDLAIYQVRKVVTHLREISPIGEL